MAAESRVKKSLLNARVNLIFYFLSLILSFFSRKIFLNTLGVDFVGLTGTLYNLLAFLNLAELGIGSAIGYVLYKPLYEHDENKICEIIAVFGYLYRWIGFIILGLGCVLACFLPLIFPATGFEYGIIYFAYFSFLASSLIGYFANYKQTLLGADQRNYVVTAYFQTATIVKTLIQLASAYYTGSYYLWVAIELIFGILYSFILNWKINQVYPWLRSEVKQGKELFRKYPEVMTKAKQLFVYKISWFTRFQITSLLIYSFVSLRMVAFYGNYDLIISKLAILIGNIFNSTSASVGNLIAEGNNNKIRSIYWELFSIHFFSVSIFVVALYFFISPVIGCWLGSEYVLGQDIVVLIIIGFFLDQMRSVNEKFLFGYGLFHDIWAPMTEVVINLIVSIICGIFWGLKGVLCGNICSNFIIGYIWKPYFLFNKGFKLHLYNYYLKFCLYLFCMAVSFCVTKLCFTKLIDSELKIIELIFKAGLFISLYATVLFLLLYLFTKETKGLTYRFIIKEKIL